MCGSNQYHGYGWLSREAREAREMKKPAAYQWQHQWLIVIIRKREEEMRKSMKERKQSAVINGVNTM